MAHQSVSGGRRTGAQGPRVQAAQHAVGCRNRERVQSFDQSRVCRCEGSSSFWPCKSYGLYSFARVVLLGVLGEVSDCLQGGSDHLALTWRQRRVDKTEEAARIL